MEKDEVLAGHDVRHAVPVVGDRSEAPAGADAVRVLLEIQLGGLAVRGLTSGQPPRFAEYLLQEGRIHLQVLGHDVQTEQVPVDAIAAHGVLIAQLVPLARFVQQLDALLGAHARVVHRLHPGRRLDRARTHGFGATLAEQPRHRGFVRERELARVPVVGQLQRHLEERIRRQATLLHQSLAVRVVHEDAQVDVLNQGNSYYSTCDGCFTIQTYIQQLLGAQMSFLDGVQRDRIVQVERQSLRLWWFKLGNAQGVAVLVVSVSFWDR